MILVILNSILLGIGVAVDAFSASIVDGLNYPKMSSNKSNLICLSFGLFQMLMPLLGWIFSRTIISYFKIISVFIPLVACAILSYLGTKMLVDGIKILKNKNSTFALISNKYLTLGLKEETLSYKTILIQGIATSIDSLSVGLTIASLTILNAFITCLIIGIITYFLCLVGFRMGKIFGKSNSSFANILGGTILIGISVQLLLQFIVSIM